MTDDIETDASTTQSISKVEPDQQQQGWTDEELMQFTEADVMIRMKCIILSEKRTWIILILINYY